ncbi:MAG: DUF4013 domain-containing protein [Haloarculaceae archaeon]
MLSEAIGYPWTGEQKLEIILVGGILSVLGFLLLPLFVVYGYLVRVVREASTGDAETPPPFEDWERLLVEGFEALIVTFVYSLLPALVLSAVAVLSLLPLLGAAMSGEPVTIGVVAVLIGLVLALLALVLSLAVAFLTPAAVGAFVRTGRLGAAFSPSEVRAVAGHGGYQSAWVVALVVVIGGGIVAGVLAATVIGAILTPFVMFYASVAAAYAIGRGISDAPAAMDGTDRQTTGQPAA